jgi:hypothetical protein
MRQVRRRVLGEFGVCDTSTAGLCDLQCKRMLQAPFAILEGARLG